MSRLILCTGKYAKTPYFFSSLCVNVYCVEELCYLFTSNPFMIHTDIMSKELAEWLDQECELKELSHQLLQLFRKGSQASTFVLTILDYVNYCTDIEKKKIEAVLSGNAGLSEYARRKNQGDFLLKNRRYRMALTIYEDLSHELPDTESALKPLLYHNMGVTYAHFFLFELAAKFFKRAYDMAGKEESGMQYLLAMRLHLREEAYIAFIAEHAEYHELSLKVERQLKLTEGLQEESEQSRMLSALKIYKDEGNVVSYYEEIDKVISDLKDDYRLHVE